MKRPQVIKDFHYYNGWKYFWAYWEGASFNPFRLSGLLEYGGWLIALMVIVSPIVIFFYLLEAIGIIRIVR